MLFGLLLLLLSLFFFLLVYVCESQRARLCVYGHQRQKEQQEQRTSNESRFCGGHQHAKLQSDRDTRKSATAHILCTAYSHTSSESCDLICFFEFDILLFFLISEGKRIRSVNVRCNSSDFIHKYQLHQAHIFRVCVRVSAVRVCACLVCSLAPRRIPPQFNPTAIQK